MTDTWDERRKALENQYFQKIDAKLIEQMRHESREELTRALCRNRCPKCGDQIQPMEFRGVPLDKCPSCGGVWLGPNDLQILSEKDHRTWFDRWFKEEH
jgi:rRNA maturation protein Nop10